MKPWTDEHYVKVHDPPASGNRFIFKGQAEQRPQGILAYSGTGNVTVIHEPKWLEKVFDMKSNATIYFPFSSYRRAPFCTPPTARKTSSGCCGTKASTCQAGSCWSEPAGSALLRRCGAGITDEEVIIASPSVSASSKHLLFMGCFPIESQVANAAKMGAAAVLIYPELEDYPFNDNTELYGHVSVEVFSIQLINVHTAVWETIMAEQKSLLFLIYSSSSYFLKSKNRLNVEKNPLL